MNYTRRPGRRRWVSPMWPKRLAEEGPNGAGSTRLQQGVYRPVVTLPHKYIIWVWIFFRLICRQSVLWGLFITYFATCSCYCVIIARNFNYVLFEYMDKFDNRITISLLLVPLILLAYVPNLKYLAPVSMVANFCMAVGLGITFYYLVIDIPQVTERPYVAHISTLPVCISVVMFAIEAIGVVSVFCPMRDHFMAI